MDNIINISFTFRDLIIFLLSFGAGYVLFYLYKTLKELYALLANIKDFLLENEMDISNILNSSSNILNKVDIITDDFFVDFKVDRYYFAFIIRINPFNIAFDTVFSN